MRQWDESRHAFRRRQAAQPRNIDCLWYLNCLDAAARENAPALSCGNCPKAGNRDGKAGIDSISDSIWFQEIDGCEQLIRELWNTKGEREHGKTFETAGSGGVVERISENSL
jgi:hypothetical protein